MDYYRAFVDLPSAGAAGEFEAIALSEHRKDFLGKSVDGNPVFLIHDSSAASYSPSIALKTVSVQFHSTCLVHTAVGAVEDQFAVISCEASSPELFELFIRCFAASLQDLPAAAVTRDIEGRVQELLRLFRALSLPNNKEISGLWGELFVIASSPDIPKAVRAWHSDQFERFDFSWACGCLEVKAATREERVHDFALEQLQAPIGGQGFVASLLLQALNGGSGVMDLAKEIEATLTKEPTLRLKLWEVVTASLGCEYCERLERRFDRTYAKRHMAIFDMRDIPTLTSPEDPRITGIRFRSNLSSTTSSLPGSFDEVIANLFS